ncbi:MAG TPA: hypothetical protein VF739_02560 [Ktedonobacterales bacterium]
MESDGGRLAMRGGLLGRMRGIVPVLLGVVTGLALCAVAYAALTFNAKPTPDPTPTARAICADLSAQRYDALYGMLIPNLQQQGSEAQFTASQRELDSLQGVVAGCTATVASQSGSIAAIRLDLRRGTSPAVSAQVTLAQANNGWQISSYDQNF